MPTSSTSHKPHYERLEARISMEKKQFLKHAADLVGRSLTEFVINSAYETASRVIKEHEQVKLSMEDSLAMIKALQAPAMAPSKVLKAAAKRYKKDVTSNDKH